MNLNLWREETLTLLRGQRRDVPLTTRVAPDKALVGWRWTFPAQSVSATSLQRPHRDWDAGRQGS